MNENRGCASTGVAAVLTSQYHQSRGCASTRHDYASQYHQSEAELCAKTRQLRLCQSVPSE